MKKQNSKPPRTSVGSKSYRLFFSHGRDDTYIANLLKPKLESTGASVFLDEGAIQYGDDFRDRVLLELSECDEFLVLLTMSSMQRAWVIAELGASLILEKRIIIVRYGPTEAELQVTGFYSLLGTKLLLTLDGFDGYVEQLKLRVGGRNDD